MYFSYVPNKWKYIDSRYSCCKDKCVNTDRPNGYCIIGNGMLTLLIKKAGVNKLSKIMAANSFNNQRKKSELSRFCLNFTLFYYEIKLQIKKKSSTWIGIGLTTKKEVTISFWPTKNVFIFLSPIKKNYIKIPSFSFKNGDIIGCGFVYSPPEINNNKLPYIFFTQNGKQIGKAILLEEDYEYLQPIIELRRCSIETNFGDYPFVYQISKHYVAEEFYKEEEFSEMK
ncbi:SPRY domain-containing protein [Meloidogyne graminicola]|uniref:SPRY domain-containing protein n=1 Tax=Meloidogyne graminicola TaxID=189291 RepID=A0A8S9ZYF5_9BILA|nr:SPRY domain-containing protein [Meloidogyne graminicola]